MELRAPEPSPPTPQVGSLGFARVIAPLVMAGAGVLAISELGAMTGGNKLVLALALLGPCAIGTTCTGWALASGRRAGFGFAALAVVLHLVLAYALMGELGVALFCVAVAWGITAVLAAPMFVVIRVLSRRNAHDAGDALLGWAGLWAFALHVLALTLVLDHGTVLGLGAAASVVPAGLAFVRGAQRRAWCRRVTRGEVPGWRARPVTSEDDLTPLAAIHGGERPPYAVVERIEIAPGAAAYRDGVVAVPVAWIPAGGLA